MREFKFRAWDTKNKKMMFAKNGTYFNDCAGCYARNVQIKVVGNIYENPELLNKE